MSNITIIREIVSFFNNLSVRVFTAIDAEFVIATFRTETQNLEYFIEDFSIYKTNTLVRLQNQGKLEDKPFLISYRFHENDDGTVLKNFAGIGDRIRITDNSVYRYGTPQYIFGFSYSNLELERLNEVHGPPSEIVLQFDTEGREISRTPPQNIVQPSRISYDSVSSLGPISSESFTISSTNATDAEDIEFGTEAITDVGGVVSRDRELDNTRVSDEIFDAVVEDEGGMSSITSESAATSRTSTVTTSGY